MPVSSHDIATTAEIRRRNYEKVYAYIYQTRRTSKQTIAQALGLSLPTVAQNLKELLDMGLIEKRGFYESTGGRKAQMICCVQDARVAIGMTILKEGVQLCAIDLFANLLREETFDLPFQNQDGYYREVGRLVNDFAKALPCIRERILGVGIAIQGLVSQDGEEMVYGLILGNTGATRQMFQQYLDYPCRMIHDTEAAATAEFWHNDQICNAVYLVLNRNMGGALIVNGQIHRGLGLSSGIIEHMTLVPGGLPCYCGKLGCVEAYCSANSLRRVSGLPFELFFQQLRAGEDQCVRIWDDYLRDLALAIDNMRMLVDCQFVLSGFLQQYLTDGDLGLLSRYVTEQSSFPGMPVTITRGRRDHRAAALGAAVYYIDAFLQQLDRCAGTGEQGGTTDVL